MSLVNLACFPELVTASCRFPDAGPLLSKVLGRNHSKPKRFPDAPRPSPELFSIVPLRKFVERTQSPGASRGVLAAGRFGVPGASEREKAQGGASSGEVMALSRLLYLFWVVYDILAFAKAYVFCLFLKRQDLFVFPMCLGEALYMLCSCVFLGLSA